MTQPPVLAIDLGGTKTLVALVGESREIEARSVATPRDLSAEAWLDAIADLASDWKDRFAAVAIAVTGWIREGRWYTLNPAVLPVPAGFPLVEGLAKRFGVPVFAANDAQSAAWGEYRFGAGQGEDMVFVTISTGVGGGIVLEGRLLEGQSGFAGSVGQMLVEHDGASIRFEDTASGGALAEQARALGHGLDALGVFAAAGRREIWADRLIDEFTRRIARHLASIQMLVDPACFVVGGGIGLADGYLDRLGFELRSIAEELRPKLRPAALGANAGLLGVADLARRHIFKRKGE